MTDKSILVEIHQLPESLKQEVMRFIAFLKREKAGDFVGHNPKKRVFGRTKGKYLPAPDFDEPLDDFKEYM